LINGDVAKRRGHTRPPLVTFSVDRYVAALRFAAARHHAQSVPGTELPYLVHVASVAAEVIAALATTPVDNPDLGVACALLHDTIEDTETTYDEILQAFGAAVADGVQALTKTAGMADSLRRIRLQPHEIWMVKLADRITNLAPPPAKWTREKCRGYREEAIAIADALGAASATLDSRLRARIASYAAFC
jgi:guanosine-3',5'-bis(diphosphate) 3'-pyrophosphohydrolase